MWRTVLQHASNCGANIISKHVCTSIPRRSLGVAQQLHFRNNKKTYTFKVAVALGSVFALGTIAKAQAEEPNKTQEYNDSSFKKQPFFQELANERDEEGITPLCVAAIWDNIEAIRLFAALGADLDLKSKEFCPLHIAIMMGHTNAALELIKLGANVNISNGSKGYTALILAAAKCNKELVDALIQAGARLNDRTGNTQESALHAVCYENNCPYVLAALLRAGANVNSVQKDGMTPLVYAIAANNLEHVKILLQHKPDVELSYKYEGLHGITPLVNATIIGNVEIVKELVKGGANVNSLSLWPEGVTALHAASFKGHIEVVRELLRAGAKVDYPAFLDKSTPLIQAASNGHLDVILELVKHGADVNAKMKGGYTALHIVAEHGKFELVEQLYYLGADMNAHSNGGTPLRVAKDQQTAAELKRFSAVK